MTWNEIKAVIDSMPEEQRNLEAKLFDEMYEDTLTIDEILPGEMISALIEDESLIMVSRIENKLTAASGEDNV